MNRTPVLVVMLIAMGAGWGLTQPLAKIAVSEGYRNFGIIFWQMLIGAMLLGAILAYRRRWPRWNRAQIGFCTLIAATGTILPNGASYQAAVYLPAGILSIVIATVPMMALPLAVSLGIDRFSVLRIAGLAAGLVGVALLVWPDTSLPDPAMAVFIPLALVAPAFYAIEGNVVAKWGTWGLDPVEVLFGASVLGCLITLPIALATGTWIDPRPPYGAPDAAIFLSSVIHALVYSTYVWMLGRTGVVFSGQVGYIVTGFGVLWAMALLGERYSSLVWIAMGLMFLGLFLVKPRQAEAVAEPGASCDDPPETPDLLTGTSR